MVELLGIFGDDLMVVNTAKVSYNKQSDFMTEKEIRLIHYLVEHKHTMPFRHPQIQFRIQCPIFVERQLFKHQVGMSASSVSGRYVDFSDSYWGIEELRLQSTDSKQGSSRDKMDETQEKFYIIKIRKHTEEAKKLYKELVKGGIAKELARTILPLNLMTTFIWTGSLLAYLQMFDQRLKPDAQTETRNIVQEMYNLIGRSGKFEHTLNAWGNK